MANRITKQLADACLDLVKSEQNRRKLAEENEYLTEAVARLVKDNKRLKSNINHLLQRGAGI